MGQVVILHGWSDSSKSFHRLKSFLEANGYDATEIWLGDYESLDDDVRVEDVAKRMQTVLQSLISGGKLSPPFDLIVHSTGGLVSREWVATYYREGTDCPAKRIIMLAPANFGSRLAASGKSLIGRVMKGWDNWLQSGQEMLRALELGSAYQWSLARRDLLDADEDGRPGPYGAGRIWPFVITGTRGYSDGLRQIVNENGSDSVVRAAAANLNAVGLTIDFSESEKRPNIREWRWRAGEVMIPFAVLPDRDHSSVIDPDGAGDSDAETQARLGMLILQALGCATDDDYAALHAQWDYLSEQTAALATDQAKAIRRVFRSDPPEPKALHQYMQFIVNACDDYGKPVDDYFLEFFAPKGAGGGVDSTRESVMFHSEILEHVHKNSISAHHRCLFIDRTDLHTRFYREAAKDNNERFLAMSVSAAQPGRNIRYFDSEKVGAKGHILVHAARVEDREHSLDARLRRNTTHLVELILPRQPTGRVFRFDS